MRPGLPIHPKFLRLVHVLQEPIPHVVGYLEMMWRVGYERGADYLGDETDVELAAQYPGTPGKLAQALLACGFIDAFDGGRYAIHDLYDNAPEYVQKRLKREMERRERGQERKHAYAPRRRPLSAAWRSNSDLGGLNRTNGAAHAAPDTTPAVPATDRPPNSELSGHRPPKADLDEPPAPAPTPNTYLPPPSKGGTSTTPEPGTDSAPSGKRKKKAAADPELEAAAARVVAHYQTVVQPGHGKEGGINNVVALLTQGLTEERLLTCADAYAAECRAKSTEPKYRVKVRNFYGTAGGYKDYLSHQPLSKVIDEQKEIDAVQARRAAAAAELAEAAPRVKPTEAK